MSWMQKLYETYDKCSGNTDIPDIGDLCPVGYSAQNAHIEVVIDAQGNFRRAGYVPKDNAKTLIPVTEKSAGRTSGEAPHPLCDSLQYCGFDYISHGGLRPSYFESYRKELQKWAQSDFSHPKVDAVYSYIEKRCLIQNLAGVGLIDLKDGVLNVRNKKDESASDEHPIMKLLTYDDKGIKDQAKIFVRWSIDGDGLCSHTWEDRSLFDAWGKYVATFDSEPGFCCATGTNATLAKMHPAKLRSGKDGAKLISSNDNAGYTFLGRLTSSCQVAGVSSEVTQKAHSALRWLIGRKQAFRNGDQVYVAWAVAGNEIPDPMANSWDFLGESDEESPVLLATDVGQNFALRLRRKMAGYAASIQNSQSIVVMGLNSASKGRLAIIYYRELTGSEFLKRIEHWHQTFAWMQDYGKDRHFVGAPAPREIAWAAFGKKVEGKNGAKLLASTVERLFPSIIDGAPLPRDLMLSAIRRASNRAGLEHWEWEKCLGIACALFRGIHQERSYRMELEDDRNTRDYLYGRLLAMAEKIESTALWMANEKRDTTAARLMQRFADRPFSTWRTIETALVPYMSRIQARMPGLLEGYKELLDEIHVKLACNGYEQDARLNGEYLLGYHCQRAWFKSHNRDHGQWVEKSPNEPEHDDVDTEVIN